MDKRVLAFGAIAHGAANVFKIGLQLIMLPLLARLTGPNEYGLYALAMPAVSFVMMLADGGLGASLAREPECNTKVWSTAFWTLLGTGLFLAAGTIAWSLVIASLIRQPRLPLIMAALSPCLLIYVLTVPSGARLLSQGRVIIAPISDFLGNAIGAMCAIALALWGAGVWSIVSQAIIVYGVRALVSIIAAPVFPKRYFSLSALRPHLSVGGSIVGLKLLDTGDRTLENVLIGRDFNSVSVGAFSLANQIARFVCESVLNPLWTNLYVQALRSEDNVSAFQAYQRLAHILALIAFPSAALVAAEATQLIALLLGPEWYSISPLLECLTLSYAFTIIGTLGSAMLYARGKSAIQLRITAIATSIRIGSVLIVPWLGLSILWVGLPLANIYTGWRNLVEVCRMANKHPAILLKSVAVSGVCATVAGLCCWILTWIMQIGVLIVIIQVACFLTLYMALLFLVDRERISGDVQDLIYLIRGR